MPFILEPQGDQDSIFLKLNVQQLDNGSLQVTNIHSGTKYITTFNNEMKVGKNKVIFRQRGIIKKGDEYEITVIPKGVAIDATLASIKISTNVNMPSYIVDFEMVSTLSKKSELILNTLIDVYNKDLTNDKMRMTRATSDFINQRLMLISKDLSGADEQVADFKSSNSTVDMSAEANSNLNDASENEKRVLEYRTQLQLVDHMSDYLKGQEDGTLLPSNIGLQDASIGTLTAAYNKLVMERDDLLKSASELNPAVIALNENISESRNNIRRSLDNYRNVTKLALNSIERKSNEIKNRISSMPNQEQGFKKISRQQQIVESLYLLLLKKREESEVKAAATPDNLKVIDAAYGNGAPVAPRKMIILLGE